MTIRPPDASTNGLLIIAGVFVLILNIGMVALLTGSPFVFELVMASLSLAVGGFFAAVFQPWQWFEKKER
jgi:hypothetical protein